MTLYIMKRDALDMLKANLNVLYGKYYTEPDSKWIIDVYGENPFIEFKDISEFSLMDLDSGLTPGEVDLGNCKILYEKLQFLSESQACDERLWAGLAHTVFYGYLRKRWGYGYGKKPKKEEKEVGEIMTRFFYKSSGRGGFYRNSLSKCWWVGHNTYDPDNINNHFDSLDIIGHNDLNSKITELFFNFTFSSNPEIMSAIVEALRSLKADGKHILVREHIRPAMSYLNAVGGSVIFDALDKDEISRIFIDAVDAIIQGDAPSLSFEHISDDETDETDSYKNDFGNNIEETLGVVLGCKIHIKNEFGEEKTYVFDYINGKIPKQLEVFSNHHIGDEIVMQGNTWKITDITLE